jgi:hypothetical protein
MEQKLKKRDARCMDDTRLVIFCKISSITRDFLATREQEHDDTHHRDPNKLHWISRNTSARGIDLDGDSRFYQVNGIRIHDLVQERACHGRVYSRYQLRVVCPCLVSRPQQHPILVHVVCSCCIVAIRDVPDQVYIQRPDSIRCVLRFRSQGDGRITDKEKVRGKTKARVGIYDLVEVRTFAWKRVSNGRGRAG